MNERPLSAWVDAIEAMIRDRGIGLVQRATVLAETQSTQDAALAHSGGKPGLVLLAGNQTGGRGRLGRVWKHNPEHGVAATFVLDAWQFSASHLAIAAGLAAHDAAAAHCPGILGVRWPNDVVERGGTGRKLAGVLIELAGPVALVGIGINIGQGEEDWPRELRGRAASLAQLGGTADRLAVVLSLVGSLEGRLKQSSAELAARWRGLDTLIGTMQTLSHDGRLVHGMVSDIDPTAHIIVAQESGERIALPALTTSLVKE